MRFSLTKPIMKKLIFPLIAISLLSVTSIASAEEVKSRAKLGNESYLEMQMNLKARMDAHKASSTERRTELKADFESRKASSTERMADRKASTTAKRIEVKQNIAKMQMTRAIKVFTVTIEHLENILARVESRIAKVKAEGGVTTQSEGFVAEVKTHLSAAKTDLAALSAIQITAENSTDNFEVVREAGQKVKAHIRLAHESLMKALRSLKSPRANVNATTTVQ